MIFYYLGCAALGLVGGFLVGGSASPVVQTTLPLLFALLGGGAGILGLTADPGSQRSQTRFRIAGLAAISLCVPFLFAAVYASHLRTGAGLKEFLPTVARTEAFAPLDANSLASLGPDESLQILMLQRNLRLAGVPSPSADSAIAFIVQERIDSLHSFAASRNEILGLAKQLSASLKDKAENAENSEITKIYLSLTSFIESAEGRTGRPTPVELALAESIQKDLSADDLMSETVTILKRDSVNSPLSSKLVAALANIPRGNILTEATRADVNSALAAAIKSSPEGGTVGIFSNDTPIRPDRS